MKQRRVSFYFDERSLVPLSQLEAQGQKYQEVRLPERILLIPEVRSRTLILADWEVRAFLAGSKTRIRRPVKFGPQFPDPGSWPHVYPTDDGGWTWTNTAVSGKLLRQMQVRAGKVCPFGAPGDRLICKETWRRDDDGTVYYRASSDFIRDHGNTWRSPATMPPWASRITLGGVKILAPHKVRDISEQDARAEGIDHATMDLGFYDRQATYTRTFQQRWDGRYAKRFPWDTAWCWAAVVRRIKP